jgi:hypothetical protein
VGRCAISISYPSPHHPLFDGAEPLTYPTPAAYCPCSVWLAYFE